MKSVKLTKKQLAILRKYHTKEAGLKMGLEALSQSLGKASEDLWEFAKKIDPKAKVIDWGKGCLEVDE